MIRTECKRGDIYLCDLGEHDGHVQGGSRPVIVLSKNNYSRSPTVIVAPITTKLKSQKLKTHIKLNREFGLKEPSLILIEQLRTVNKNQMTDYIGRVSYEILAQVDIALSKTLGSCGGKVKYLCNACRVKKMKTNFIRKIDPFEKATHYCSYCDSKLAFRYIICHK